MSYSRRTFVIGAASGFSLLVLTACTDGPPAPIPTPTRTSPIDDLPVEKSFARSNWAGDPYALGATSYLSVGALPQRETLQQPVLDRVVLAGEAISDEPGTIRGAIASGRAAANALLKAMDDGERVAVIGAGAAGAAAARVLSVGGAEVIVLEARDRTGGRIDSNVDDSDVPFELGAWRLSERNDTSVVEALAREGVEVEPLAGSVTIATEGATTEVDAALTNASAAVVDAVAWAQEQPADVPFAEALRTVADLPAVDGVSSEQLLDQALLAVTAATGASADELSAWFAPELDSESLLPTGPLSSFVDGALEGIDTALSTVVVSISYDKTGVSLRLGTGESLAVDRVVVTVPLAVLQQQLIEFDPPLPVGHRGALAELSVGHLELVRLEFDEPFWTTDALWWVSDESDQAIRLWINLMPATGRAVLLGVVGGQAALDLTEVSDARVREAAQQSLAPFVRAGI